MIKMLSDPKFWKRVFTVLLYGPIAIIAVYLGDVPFFMMIFLAAFLSILEMYNMYTAKYQKVPDQFNLALVFTALALSSAYMQEFFYLWDNKYLVLLTLLAIAYFNIELICKKIFFSQRPNFFVARIIAYIGLMYPFMLRLRNAPHGLEHVIYLVATVWTNDIFAYLIGLPLGRHKLSPEISPKKSIEGAIGAALGAVLMSVNLRMLINANLCEAIFFGLAISLLAQTGDLIESLLKREFQIKDSGNIFPGHGGILDRLDSFILTVPVVYIFINYVH